MMTTARKTFSNSLNFTVASTVSQLLLLLLLPGVDLALHSACVPRCSLKPWPQLDKTAHPAHPHSVTHAHIVTCHKCASMCMCVCVCASGVNKCLYTICQVVKKIARAQWAEWLASLAICCHCLTVDLHCRFAGA